jgi:hypothetical protein
VSGGLQIGVAQRVPECKLPFCPVMIRTMWADRHVQVNSDRVVVLSLSGFSFIMGADLVDRLPSTNTDLAELQGVKK